MWSEINNDAKCGASQTFKTYQLPAEHIILGEGKKKKTLPLSSSSPPHNPPLVGRPLCPARSIYFYALSLIRHAPNLRVLSVVLLLVRIEKPLHDNWGHLCFFFFFCCCNRSGKTRNSSDGFKSIKQHRQITAQIRGRLRPAEGMKAWWEKIERLAYR